MDVADVPLQIRWDGEGSIAVLALVRLLARVRPQVSRQISRAREHLPAELARIAIPRFRRPGAARHDRRGRSHSRYQMRMVDLLLLLLLLLLLMVLLLLLLLLLMVASEEIGREVAQGGQRREAVEERREDARRTSRQKVLSERLQQFSHNVPFCSADAIWDSSTIFTGLFFFFFLDHSPVAASKMIRSTLKRIIHWFLQGCLGIGP